MRQILFNSSVFFDRAAILTDGKLEELIYEEKKTGGLLGNIYKGRVMNILPGMNAAFVDIGLGKNAYLYIDALLTDRFLAERNIVKKEAASIDRLLKKGDELMVQINREPIGEKNVSVTADISLPGKYLALIPESACISVSRKVRDKDERNRLYGIGKSIMQSNLGMILRTYSEHKAAADIKTEYDMLVATYMRMKKEFTYSYAPKLLHRSNPIVDRVLRDYIDSGVDVIYTEDKKTRQAVEEIVKDYRRLGVLKDTELLDADNDVFDMLNVTEQIDALLDRKIDLDGGGSIYIDVTEAMTVIDVNSGSFTGKDSIDDTALSINLRATDEIARQVRLRNISGIILTDFIDMKTEGYNDRLVEAMKCAFKKDKSKTKVIGMTKLNIMEMTRKKDKDNFFNLMTEDCPNCHGSGRIASASGIAYRMESIVKRVSRNTSSEAVMLTAGMAVCSKIRTECMDMVEKIESVYGIKIYIVEDIDLYGEDIKLYRMGKDEYIQSLLQCK